MMMGTMGSNHFCCSVAAAAAPAHNMPTLDTAMELVVSICVPIENCRAGM